MDKILTYTGNALNENQGDIKAYLPSAELVTAVNVALYLDRPLLLMGEPGCGKTRLAEALAYEIHGDKMNDHFFKWYIKSSTKAQEGICQINYLQRLYDVNMQKKGIDLKDEQYLMYGKLANAFMTAANGNKPNILLIDEIDKADIDFPNDLLLELDKKEFIVPETNRVIEAKSKVVVIITSNREKELPDAFLRRCIYHYINFPDTEKLNHIVAAQFGALSDKEKDFLAKAIDVFTKLRQQNTTENKNVSTSELLDWYKMLQYAQTLSERKALSKPEEQLVEQLNLLGGDKIPFKEVLLKTYETYLNNDTQ